MTQLRGSSELGLREVAHRLQISDRSVYRLMELGVLSAVNRRSRGRKLQFAEEDVALLANASASGRLIRQLTPSASAHYAAHVLGSCDDAERLLRQARDLVLDSLDVIYRATKHEDVYRVLKMYGRNPHDE